MDLVRGAGRSDRRGGRGTEQALCGAVNGDDLSRLVSFHGGPSSGQGA